MTIYDISAVRQEVCARLPAKRLSHVLAVEKQIVWLGEQLMPARLMELRVAALLHDIAKYVPDEEQIALCQSLGIALTEEEKSVPPIIHAKSGAFIAKRDFSLYVNDEILSAILRHTTAVVKMPLFERLLMLADFTEETRKWQRCQEARAELLHLTDYTTQAEKIAYVNHVFYEMLRKKYDFITTSIHTTVTGKDILAYYKRYA